LGFFQKTKDGIELPYPAKPGLYMLYIPSLPGEGAGILPAEQK
jgi:hypothetical protein